MRKNFPLVANGYPLSREIVFKIKMKRKKDYALTLGTTD